MRDVDSASLSKPVCQRLLTFLPSFVDEAVTCLEAQKDENLVAAAQNAMFCFKLLAQIMGAGHPELFEKVTISCLCLTIDFNWDDALQIPMDPSEQSDREFISLF